MSKYTTIYIEALVLLALPIFLMTISSEVLYIRHALMAIGGIYSAWRLIKSSASFVDLGFHRSGFIESLKALVIPSILLILTSLFIFLVTPLPLLKVLVGYDSMPEITMISRIIIYTFITVPVQELIFRGYITWRIKEVYQNPREIESISIAIFTLAHLPFHSPLILVVTFLMGLVYIKNYLKYQNIYTVIISHAIVGAGLIMIRNAWFPF